MLILLSLLACGPKAPAPPGATPPGPVIEPTVQAAPAPRLAVVLVVDQLPAALFEALRPHFAGGFARLTRDDAWVGTARYHHAAALTCPGHATLATGASPATHGIVGNSWIEDGASKYCGDIDNLRSQGIADRVVEAGGSVASLSLKDRAAIMLGGRSPTARAWYDKKAGTWAEGAPEWMPTDGITEALTTPWEARNPELYATLYDDDQPWEADAEALGGHTFPKTAPGADAPRAFTLLPAAGTVLTDAAIQAVDQLSLGADDTGDLLAISYSQTDYIGHTFTAQSWEAMDGLMALDADLGRLFDALDERVGPDHYAVFLSSDHGAAPGDSARIPMGPVGEAVDKVLASHGLEGEAMVGANCITVPNGEQAAREAAIRDVAAVFEDREGFAGAWAWQLDGIPDDVPHRDAILASLDPGRSGDVYVLMAEGALMANSVDDKGTDHGTPWAYDTVVPLLAAGARVPAGTGEQVDARALAPTVAAWLGLAAPEDAEVEALSIAPIVQRGAPREPSSP